MRLTTRVPRAARLLSRAAPTYTRLDDNAENRPRVLAEETSMIEQQSVDRRQMLKKTGLMAAAALAASVGGSASGANAPESPVKKSLKFGMVEVPGSVLDKFRVLKDVGFDGVELD